MSLANLNMAPETVLDIRGLRLEAIADSRVLIPGLNLSIQRGEIVGLVGQSGSGKTLTCYAVGGLTPPGVRVTSGEIHLQGRRIDNLPEAEWRAIRGGHIGMVFQDPLSSFNPVKTVGSILIESARRHRKLDKAAARALAIETLQAMRLPGPNASIDAWPHQLSGGQRQRAMIGLALINQPALILADEPTTALDPTVQLQILALLRRQAQQAAALMITHDISAAGAVCDRIAVMLDGEIIEEGPTNQVLYEPMHPFTRSLRDAAHLGTRP
ncbi:ABC transporter ATP-binding protein [Brevundimonas diminuta]|uniref:ABC transporter ATP-binding protein n=1 Tax=Brevundimonas diminuta TaxID=293 RepID=UPI00320A7055